MNNFLGCAADFTSLIRTLTIAFMLCFCITVNASGSFNTFVRTLPSDTPIDVFIDKTNAKSLSIIGRQDLQTHQWLSNQDGEFSEFVRINVSAAGSQPWDVMVKSNDNNKAITKGDWVYGSYYVRASGDTDIANIRGYVERSVPSWMQISDASVAAGSNWTRVVAVGVAPENFAINSVFISLHLAIKQQTLDIADMIFLSLPADIEAEVFSNTPLGYLGMEQDAPWRVKAKQMIKNNREAEFEVFVLDKYGVPVPNEKVTINLQDVDYELGSMANALLVADSELAEQYRLWFKQFFNYATATIYWADWGWENPDSRTRYLNKMAYFKRQNIDMRAHVLLYPGFRFSPQVLIDLQGNKAAFIKRVNQQIDEMVPILKKFGIREYDVINELRDEKDWLDIVGIDTVVQWFKRVHALHPEAILYINENAILTDGGDNKNQNDQYFSLITELLNKGAPIHGIGMQGHFNGIVTPVEKMWKILDKFATFNLPIRITEYDTNTGDIHGQALFDTDFYEAMYAHPATVGITRWGFYEPEMWTPAGALIDSENNLKPNAVAYLHWLEALRENQQNIKSNKLGAIIFAGKYGRYSVIVKDHSFTCIFVQPSIVNKPSQSMQSCTVRLER